MGRLRLDAPSPTATVREARDRAPRLSSRRKTIPVLGYSFGRVSSPRRESAGPVPRPGQPATVRPEFHRAECELLLSVTPDRADTSRPTFSERLSATAVAAAFAGPVEPPQPAFDVSGPRPRRPAIGPPGFRSVYVEWFAPRRSGLPHQPTLARLSLQVLSIIAERLLTAKDLEQDWHHLTPAHFPIPTLVSTSSAIAARPETPTGTCASILMHNGPPARGVPGPPVSRRKPRAAEDKFLRWQSLSYSNCATRLCLPA